MTKPATTIEHADTELPSTHINHSAVFANELDAKIMNYANALMAVDADIEGMQQAYDKAQSEAATKHAEAMESRDRLKRDITRSKKMAEAARSVYADDIPVTEGDE